MDWDADRDWDWHSAARDTLEQLLQLWQDAGARSRSLVSGALERGGLEQTAARIGPDGQAPSLRGILCRMVDAPQRPR